MGCSSLDSLEDMKDDTFAESFNILCTITSASYGSRYCQYFGIPIRFPGENAPVSGLLKNGPFRYVVLEDDTAAIISAEADGVLVFPSMLDGHPVSAIGLENSASLYQLYEEAGLRKENYEYCCVIGQECTSAVIPEGVTLIGNSVFQGCDLLLQGCLFLVIFLFEESLEAFALFFRFGLGRFPGSILRRGRFGFSVCLGCLGSFRSFGCFFFFLYDFLLLHFFRRYYFIIVCHSVPFAFLKSSCLWSLLRRYFL